MDINEYALEWHARLILAEARAVSARAALVPRRESVLRPTLAAAVTAARALYQRATHPNRVALRTREQRPEARTRAA